MEFLTTVFVSILSTTLATHHRRGTFVLPEPLGPEAPICSSYNQLCHLAYNITDGVVQSEQEICSCPGNRVCETSWDQTDNSIIEGLKLSGNDITVKMSYCHLNQPNRVCRKNEEAIIMRGRGHFSFEVVQDFQCRCYRDLYEHRSWREGAYTYFAYSCGKPKCNTNRSPNLACAMFHYDGAPGQFRIDYRCRCLRNYECTASQLPTATNRHTSQRCERVGGYGNHIYHADY